MYGGVVGYLDFAGDADTAIAIRTAVLRAGTACRPARASSRTSDPVAEDLECQTKAAAVLSAIAVAETFDQI